MRSVTSRQLHCQAITSGPCSAFSEGQWPLYTVKERTGRRFAAGSDDKKVFIWDILASPLEHPAVKFSPDGGRIARTTTLVTGSSGIYNTQTGQRLKNLPVAQTIDLRTKAGLEMV